MYTNVTNHIVYLKFVKMIDLKFSHKHKYVQLKHSDKEKGNTS